MFGDHFYHAITRKTVAVFGTLFNDIEVVRRSSDDDSVSDRIKVPIAYGPKSKYLARLDEQESLTDPKVAIKLPRISFEVSSIEYDSSAKLSQHNIVPLSRTDTTAEILQGYAPYRMSIDMSIYAKTQDDGLQIVEQIIPNFQPDYTIVVKYFPGVDYSYNLPIVLESISLDDDYEGDLVDRRVIIYSLSFGLKTRYFGGASKRSVVRRVDVSMLNQLDNNKKIQQLTETFLPVDAETRDDITEYRQNVFELPPDGDLIIRSNPRLRESEAIQFLVGETVIGSDSQSMAIVQSQSFTNTGIKTVVIEQPDNWFQIGEQIVGAQSGSSFVIASISE